MSIWLELGWGAQLACRFIECWKQMQFYSSGYSLGMEGGMLGVIGVRKEECEGKQEH